MARTQGHGNPNWTRDETILALDLYLDCEGNIPSSEDKRVKALSNLLRSLPYHEVAARRDSFRNPAGVAFKLQNLRQVATGKGLGNVSDMDRKIWAEFGSTPHRVKEVSSLIQEGIKSSEFTEETYDDEEFSEGRLITELHKRRERNPSVRNKLLSLRRKRGKLSCDMCGNYSNSGDTRYEDVQFEAHHIIPVSMAKEHLVRLKDMAILCANCHRLLHRAIAYEKRWLGVEEGRFIIRLLTIKK